MWTRRGGGQEEEEVGKCATKYVGGLIIGRGNRDASGGQVYGGAECCGIGGGVTEDKGVAPGKVERRVGES